MRMPVFPAATKYIGTGSLACIISGWLLMFIPLVSCSKSRLGVSPVPLRTGDTLSRGIADTAYEKIPQSARYEVTILRGDQRQKCMVFESACPEYRLGYMNMVDKDRFPLEIFKGRSIGWTDFSFAGSVTVEVRLIGGTGFSGPVKILPSRHGITPAVNGNVIRFDIGRPGQYSVELGADGYKNGLMIFANPPETDIPDTLSRKFRVFARADQQMINAVPAGYSGVYFKKGIHDIGIFRVPSHIKDIYFEEGSWVYGALVMVANPNVRISGRGVLSSARLNYRESHCVEAINGSDNIRLEGIVVADVKHFAVRLIGRNNTVSWVKTIGGWTYNCDGISAFEGSTVRNCFIWANDDNIKVYRDNIGFSDIVCWQLNNGGVIQLSWGNANARNVTIRRVDILHAEWNRDEPNRGVISCVGDKFAEGGMYGYHGNFLIEDLVTETPVPLVFRISPNPASPDRIEGMIFKDWKLSMNMNSSFRNYIVGTDPGNRYEGIVFDNVVFNGTRLNASNWIGEGKFVIDNIDPPVFK